MAYSGTVKSIAGLVDAVALRSPLKMAVKSPFQNDQSFTYEQLSKTTNALAGWLQLYGYEKHDILVSSLPNISENLLLQLACNRLGVGYATAKNLEMLAQFPKIKGAVTVTDSDFLAETGLPLPPLSGDFLLDLIHNGLDEFSNETAEQGELSTPHGFYNSAAPYTNQQGLDQGRDAVDQLYMHDEDVVCVSITLCHPFGIGSAVTSTLMSGACIVLPAVGGIQGCGVPSERAAATLQVLKDEQCTLLFADTHTLKALPEPPHNLVLRGGCCKIGSGSTFLSETREYAHAQLRTIGKKD